MFYMKKYIYLFDESDKKFVYTTTINSYSSRKRATKITQKADNQQVEINGMYLLAHRKF